MAADSTLSAIIKKVRRLTKSPSASQITDTNIKEYVNTFIEYDFPEHLRHEALRTNFTFYTKPYQDVYETNAIVGDPFYDFKNQYITVKPPIYIGGKLAAFTTSQAEFYALYPKNNAMSSIGVGDGATVNYTGTLTYKPVIKNAVLFSSVDINDAGLELHDDGEGVLSGDGVGTIDYITGVYDITFSVAPKSLINIYSQTVPYTAARPSTIMFYDMKFTLRPVPDQAYRVEMEAFIKPSAFLDTTSNPTLKEWWQYIAYGAAKKVLEDRMDVESIAMIMPEFKKQESLVNSRTIVQQSYERTPTIYSGNYNNNSNRWGSNNL